MGIVIGYQGVGKSTMCRKHNDCIDLESSSFWFKDKNGNPKRWDNWFDIYGNIAEHLSKQGNIVCIASHFAVRQRLKNTTEKVYVVVPSLELRDRWVKRLYYRYLDTATEKDYKAWMNAGERYEQDIQAMMDDAKNYDWKLVVIKPEDLDQDLFNKVCGAMCGGGGY